MIVALSIIAANPIFFITIYVLYRRIKVCRFITEVNRCIILQSKTRVNVSPIPSGHRRTISANKRRHHMRGDHSRSVRQDVTYITSFLNGWNRSRVTQKVGHRDQWLGLAVSLPAHIHPGTSDTRDKLLIYAQHQLEPSYITRQHIGYSFWFYQNNGKIWDLGKVDYRRQYIIRDCFTFKYQTKQRPTIF